MSVITPNVFAPSLFKGKNIMPTTGLTLNAKVYCSSGNTLVPGTQVKLVDVAGDILIVDTAAATDDIFGVVLYDESKVNSYTANDVLTIGSLGSIVLLEASGAVAQGDFLQYVASGAKVATATTGTKIGKALRKAADAAIFPVLILVPGLVQSFTDLNDVPSAFTDAGGKTVTVNSGATALEFTTTPTT